MQGDEYDHDAVDDTGGWVDPFFSFESHADRLGKVSQLFGLR
jgi:hypothetical protein